MGNVHKIKEVYAAIYKPAVDALNQGDFDSANKILDIILKSDNFEKNAKIAGLNLIDYYTNKGTAEYHLKNEDEAVKYFKKVLELDLNNLTVNRNMGIIMMNRGTDQDLLECTKYFEICLMCEFNMTVLDKLLDSYSKLARYDKVLEKSYLIDISKKMLITTYTTFATAMTIFGIHDRALECSNIAISMIKDSSVESKSIIYTQELLLAMYSNIYDTNRQLISKELYEYHQMCYNDIIATNMSEFAIRQPNERPRIGFISYDFRNHPVGHVTGGFFKNHNPEKFDLYCYSTFNKGSDKYLEAFQALDNITWKDIQELNDDAIIKTIKDDKIDILVEMMGYTRGSKIQIVHQKPAPVIVSYFAYPASILSPAVDYKLMDSICNTDRDTMFEKPLILSCGLQCYEPILELPPYKKEVVDYGKKDRMVIFGVTNNPSKITTECFNVWADILKGVPGSGIVLTYIYYNLQPLIMRIQNELIKRGVDEKLIHVQQMDRNAYLTHHNKIDICLDTFPYSGGTVSSEALYYSTPIITLANDCYRGRITMSLETHLGFEELIAANIDEYRDKAIALAKDPERLKMYHTEIHKRAIKSPLFDSKQFTPILEDTLLSVYKNIIK